MKNSIKTKLNLLSILCLAIWVLVIAAPVAANSFDDAARALQSGNYNKAFEILEPMAREGNVNAQYNLGRMYAKGKGVSRDFAKAVHWFRKAADQGYVSAQYNLGVMYDNGQGVDKSYTDAIQWYHKAADQGHPKAQFSLGFMNANGQGVTQNFEKTIKWYGKAADQGHSMAQFFLGLLYMQGKGTSQDALLAYKWLSLSEAGLPSGRARDDANKMLNFLREKLAADKLARAENLVKEWKSQHKRK